MMIVKPREPRSLLRPTTERFADESANGFSGCYTNCCPSKLSSQALTVLPCWNGIRPTKCSAFHSPVFWPNKPSFHPPHSVHSTATITSPNTGRLSDVDLGLEVGWCMRHTVCTSRILAHTGESWLYNLIQSKRWVINRNRL